MRIHFGSDDHPLQETHLLRKTIKEISLHKYEKPWKK